MANHAFYANYLLFGALNKINVNNAQQPHPISTTHQPKNVKNAQFRNLCQLA